MRTLTILPAPDPLILSIHTLTVTVLLAPNPLIFIDVCVFQEIFCA